MDGLEQAVRESAKGCLCLPNGAAICIRGVKLNIIMGNEVSVGQGILNVILASNDFPDLLFVHQDKEVIQLSDRSYSQPLDELAAQYCPRLGHHHAKANRRANLLGQFLHGHRAAVDRRFGSAAS